MENFGKNVHVMPCEKNSEREKYGGDVLPPLWRRCQRCQRRCGVCLPETPPSGLCNERMFFLKTEMHANTKQNIYFSQARQIEKCAMFQNHLYTFQVRIIITCFFSCNLDEWVMGFTLKRRTCTAVQTRLMNARCLLFLLTVLLCYIYWQSALN